MSCCGHNTTGVAASPAAPEAAWTFAALQLSYGDRAVCVVLVHLSTVSVWVEGRAAHSLGICVVCGAYGCAGFCFVQGCGV